MLKIEKREEEYEKKEQQRRKNGKKTEEERFSEMVDSINRDKASSPGNYKIGKDRETLFEEALKSLKKERKIRDFIPVSELSRPNLMAGIDFYVVEVDGTGQYETYRINVTGHGWVKKHQNRHPNVSVIAVDSRDTLSSIEHKIIELIEK